MAITALAALVSAGCSTHAVRVSAASDPGYAVSLQDPVYVALPEDSTVHERALLPELLRELCVAKANVVKDASEAKVVLGLSYDRHTYLFGSRTMTTVVPAPPGGAAVVLSKSTPNVVTDSSAHLYLFTAESVRDARPVAIWEAEVSAPDNVFQVYRPIIFGAALDLLGRTREGNYRLEKAYLKKVKQCLRENESGESVDCCF